MLSLLNMVGTNLTTLDIVTPPSHVFMAHWTPKSYELLDSKLSDSHLQLPNLKHLHLGPGSIRVSEGFHYFLSIAPSLVSFTIHLDDDLGLPDYNALSHISGSTLLELYITTDRHPGGQMRKYARLIAHLLSMVPHIRRLSLDYDGRLSWAGGSLVHSVGGLQFLEDLHWPTDADVVGDDPNSFPSLRRAIFSPTTWNVVVR